MVLDDLAKQTGFDKLEGLLRTESGRLEDAFKWHLNFAPWGEVDSLYVVKWGSKGRGTHVRFKPRKNYHNWHNPREEHASAIEFLAEALGLTLPPRDSDEVHLLRQKVRELEREIARKETDA